MNYKIDSHQLLDCLADGQQLITPTGMPDLRSTLKNLGYGGAGVSLPTCDISDVLHLADELVSRGYATWQRAGWLQITPDGLFVTGRKDMVVQFGTEYVADLVANNYFGDVDGYQLRAIRAHWLDDMSDAGYEMGQTYFKDKQFEYACTHSLELTLNRINNWIKSQQETD
jgi:hypothetical protein